MSEIEEVRQKYIRGELDHIRGDLERFISSHRFRIVQFRDQYNSRHPRRPLDDALAIKFYILRIRSINARQEIQDQLKEIEQERVTRSEKTGTEPDAHEVAMDWARLYSPAWRAHRVTAIIYVFEQDRERYASLLA
jgi:hypothetical protein